ncbi:collagen alpha-1(I) chain-like [Ornithorhynchus anatinus]|uniref:collagen alpha-1(I) chain-like n=1 Tax=Ornithorhynchus anatinus TaxID=9258 RepID=UPI0019D43FAC|nr:collagen alpha-1(I) chain-like [Ornithorhynchus anatinus]
MVARAGGGAGGGGEAPRPGGAEGRLGSMPGGHRGRRSRAAAGRRRGRRRGASGPAGHWAPAREPSGVGTACARARAILLLLLGPPLVLRRASPKIALPKLNKEMGTRGPTPATFIQRESAGWREDAGLGAAVSPARASCPHARIYTPMHLPEVFTHECAHMHIRVHQHHFESKFRKKSQESFPNSTPLQATQLSPLPPSPPPEGPSPGPQPRRKAPPREDCPVAPLSAPWAERGWTRGGRAGGCREEGRGQRAALGGGVLRPSFPRSVLPSLSSVLRPSLAAEKAAAPRDCGPSSAGRRGHVGVRRRGRPQPADRTRTEGEVRRRGIMMMGSGASPPPDTCLRLQLPPPVPDQLAQSRPSRDRPFGHLCEVTVRPAGAVSGNPAPNGPAFPARAAVAHVGLPPILRTARNPGRPGRPGLPDPASGFGRWFQLQQTETPRPRHGSNEAPPPPKSFKRRRGSKSSSGRLGPCSPPGPRAGPLARSRADDGQGAGPGGVSRGSTGGPGATLGRQTASRERAGRERADSPDFEAGEGGARRFLPPPRPRSSGPRARGRPVADPGPGPAGAGRGRSWGRRDMPPPAPTLGGPSRRLRGSALHVQVGGRPGPTRETPAAPPRSGRSHPVPPDPTRSKGFVQDEAWCLGCGDGGSGCGEEGLRFQQPTYPEPRRELDRRGPGPRFKPSSSGPAPPALSAHHRPARRFSLAQALLPPSLLDLGLRAGTEEDRAKQGTAAGPEGCQPNRWLTAGVTGGGPDPPPPPYPGPRQGCRAVQGHSPNGFMSPLNWLVAPSPFAP